MERFGEAKADWLRERLGLRLTGGVPSHDTFGRVFARLDPDAFCACFLAWTRALHEQTGGQVVALDGKTLRRSFDRAAGKAALHLVSAWAEGSRLVLGQVAVDGKSNEITAIPALLSLLDLRGCTVTIDAMGCQKAIAEQSVAGGGDYVLALKGNQSTLHEDVRLFFEDARAHDFFQKNPQQRIAVDSHRTCEKDHGRIETRRCWTVTGDEIAWLSQRPQWRGLQSLGAVECERRVGETVQKETRYFLSSLSGGAAEFLAAVRGHWGIENRLHWVLDVALNEDACRIREGHAPQNMATLRHLTLNLLRQEKTDRAGVKRRQLRAGWDEDYLLRVLTA